MTTTWASKNENSAVEIKTYPKETYIHHTGQTRHTQFDHLWKQNPRERGQWNEDYRALKTVLRFSWTGVKTMGLQLQLQLSYVAEPSVKRTLLQRNQEFNTAKMNPRRLRDNV